MNLFAINAAALNDSNEVWSWYGSAELVADSALDPAIFVRPDLEGTLQVESAGEAIYGRAAEGDALIPLQADGDGTRWTLGASDIAVEFDVAGDGVVSGTGGGYFPITVDSSMVPHIATSSMLEGLGRIEVRSSIVYRNARPVRLEAESRVYCSAPGAGFLVIDAPGMGAVVALSFSGEGRIGGRLYGETQSALQVYSRGTLSLRHYVYAEGAAMIQVQARTEKAGIPPIPETYIAAPAARSLQVNNEPRLFTVPAERRL